MWVGIVVTAHASQFQHSRSFPFFLINSIIIITIIIIIVIIIIITIIIHFHQHRFNLLLTVTCLKWRVTHFQIIHPKEGRCIRSKYRWIKVVKSHSSFLSNMSLLWRILFMMNACERLYILHYTLYTLLHYISLYIYYTTQYTDGNNWLSCLMYSTPVALVDQRRRVFVKSPIEARGT